MNERPMRPKPLMPDPYRHDVLRVDHGLECRRWTTAEPRGPPPVLAGSCADAVGSRRRRPRTGSTPERPDRGLVGREARRRRRTGSASTRPPCSSTARRWSVRVEAVGLGHLGAQVADLHDPARRRRPAASRSSRHAEHRQQARVERARARARPGRPRAIAATASGHAGASAGTRLDPADPAGASSAPRPGPRPPRPRRRPSARRGRWSPGRTRPDRVEQPAGLVERRGEVAERLGEPDDHQVAERVAVELARREAVLERLGPDASRRRRARRGTCAGRPGPGRRGRAGAGRTSRRRRRRSTTAVIVARVARGRARSVIARPCPPPSATTLGPARDRASGTFDVPVVDRRVGAEPGEQLARAPRRSTTLRWRPPVQPIAIERYDLPSRSYAGSSSANSRSSSLEERLRLGLAEHVVAHRRVGAGRAGGAPRPSAGSGRKRQSNTRSTSSGRPCL